MSPWASHHRPAPARHTATADEVTLGRDGWRGPRANRRAEPAAVPGAEELSWGVWLQPAPPGSAMHSGLRRPHPASRVHGGVARDGWEFGW